MDQLLRQWQEPLWRHAFRQSTVLIKLWFWIVHTKLEILRELKVLRMDLALQRNSMGALEEAARIDPKILPFNVSKAESLFWRALIVGCGFLLGLEIALHGPGFGGRGGSFKETLINISGNVAPGQTNTIPFNPTSQSLVCDLRADTQHGTVSFEVAAPDGRLLGTQTGGGLTIENWTLPASERGTYTLRVISHDATGRWQVHLDQTDRDSR